jgi:pSer/pThr/pTyr-binding forkhead associated (FHA) protein
VPAPLVFPPGGGVRFTIGRTRDCDLCLTDMSVSRMHAQLVRREDGWLLSDLGSHNGTRVNGWLVREPVPVRAGDRVEFGSATFVFQGDPPGEARPGEARPGEARPGEAPRREPSGEARGEAPLEQPPEEAPSG